MNSVWTRVAPAGDCLVWTGSRTPYGYGHVNVGGHRYEYVHRIAYRETHGPIPDGMVVMHSCDNPPCVRPDHLRLGSYRDNANDMVAKGRSRPGSPRRGSEWLPPRFTPDRAAALRAEYRAGGITYPAMAAREGVATVTIARLIRGQSYPDALTRHPSLPEEP